MLIGILGGSFDPPHLGHALGCLWAMERGGLDRVLAIPAAAHAFGKQFRAPYADRLAMCALAMRRISGAEPCDIEGRRGGVSYMIDTLEELAREFPGAQFRLVVGSDVAAEVPKWRRAEEVLAIAPILEMPRPRPGDSAAERAACLPPVSSTLVREVLAAGGDATSLVGAAVQEYIRAHGLYR